MGITTGAVRELELALVELDGLSAARSEGSPEDREELDAGVAALLRAQSWGGAAATELEHDRFALVRARGESPQILAARLNQLLRGVTDSPITPSAGTVSMSGTERPAQMMKALRYTLDGFSREGSGWPAPGNLAEALNAAMDHTLAQAGALGTAISGKDFQLAYQPVVDLASRALHHYEILVRFGDDKSPFPQIRMAEEMDLIEALDFAILEKAAAEMARDAALSLAVNVSGRTIVSAAYIDRVLGLVARQPDLSGRLMFELTESAAIDDLPLADRHLQALRGAGCQVCLDDFGAGSASLAYLQQLHFDVLKIDGRYIRDLQFGGRGTTFIKHIVEMCRDLKIRTLAEMVETSAVEDEVRRAGVDMAQGWLYGLAADEPIAPVAKNRWKKAISPPTRASHSSSLITCTPCFCASASLEPAPGPATTRSVFFDTEPETLAPRASAWALASSRVIFSRAPVNTTVLPATAVSVFGRSASMTVSWPIRSSTSARL